MDLTIGIDFRLRYHMVEIPQRLEQLQDIERDRLDTMCDVLTKFRTFTEALLKEITVRAQSSANVVCSFVRQISTSMLSQVYPALNVNQEMNSTVQSWFVAENPLCLHC